MDQIHLTYVFYFLNRDSPCRYRSEKPKHAQNLQFGAQKWVWSIFIEFFYRRKKNWTGVTLMLWCYWLDNWVCEPLFLRKKLRDIGPRFFIIHHFVTVFSCKTTWEGQQVLIITFLIKKWVVWFFQRCSGGTVFGLVADLVEKGLKWSEFEKKWKFATVGKRGNLVIRTSLRSTRRVEEALPHKLKNLPHTTSMIFTTVFSKPFLKKSRYLPPKLFFGSQSFTHQSIYQA